VSRTGTRSAGSASSPAISVRASRRPAADDEGTHGGRRLARRAYLQLPVLGQQLVVDGNVGSGRVSLGSWLGNAVLAPDGVERALARAPMRGPLVMWGQVGSRFLSQTIGGRIGTVAGVISPPFRSP